MVAENVEQAIVYNRWVADNEDDNYKPNLCKALL